jgi:hypothetical protein
MAKRGEARLCKVAGVVSWAEAAAQGTGLCDDAYSIKQPGWKASRAATDAEALVDCSWRRRVCATGNRSQSWSGSRS